MKGGELCQRSDRFSDEMGLAAWKKKNVNDHEGGMVGFERRGSVWLVIIKGLRDRYVRLGGEILMGRCVPVLYEDWIARWKRRGRYNQEVGEEWLQHTTHNSKKGNQCSETRCGVVTRIMQVMHTYIPLLHTFLIKNIFFLS